jgi:hypothetical protein
MFFSRKIKESPHFQRLKESLDYTFEKRQVLILTITFGLIMLMFVPVLILGAQSANVMAGMAVVMLWFLTLVGIWAYTFHKWVEIFLHIDSYIFRQAQLDHPHVKGRGGTYYTVEFTDRNGKTLRRDTRAMFTSAAEPFLEDYNNKTVTIGYNEKTDRLVVLRRT